MEGGGGGEKKKQPGTSSGGAGDMTMTIADELSGRKGKAVDPNPTSLSSAGAFHPDATVRGFVQFFPSLDCLYFLFQFEINLQRFEYDPSFFCDLLLMRWRLSLFCR